jgi:hypothetical protein
VQQLALRLLDNLQSPQLRRIDVALDRLGDESAHIVGMDRVELDAVAAGPVPGPAVAGLGRPRRQPPLLDLLRGDRELLERDIGIGGELAQGLLDLVGRVLARVLTSSSLPRLAVSATRRFAFRPLPGL